MECLSDLASLAIIQFKGMAIDSLTLEAARLAESRNVQYCNFTLRPLSYDVHKPDGGKELGCGRSPLSPSSELTGIAAVGVAVAAGKVKTEKIKLYDTPVHIENAHFMEVSSLTHPPNLLLLALIVTFVMYVCAACDQALAARRLQVHAHLFGGGVLSAFPLVLHHNVRQCRVQSECYRH